MFEDFEHVVPVHSVVCFFLVTEGEDAAEFVFFAVVDDVLHHAGHVASAFAWLEGCLDRVDEVVNDFSEAEGHGSG